MSTLKDVLLRTQENLDILQEREAKYGGNAPLELLNQISDHQTAIALMNEALSAPLTENALEQLKEQLRPMLVASNVEQINLDDVKIEIPPLPFEPETVPVAAGTFFMGSDDGPDEESPRHTVNLAAYRIGKYLVTNVQYAEFLQQEKLQPLPKKAGWSVRREPPQDKLDHPVIGVSWHEALAYCTWLSGKSGRKYRLPTEAEWEKAASWDGQKQLQYPWGDDFLQDNCNSVENNLNDTTAVDKYLPQGNSPYGCADMAGNVQEWTGTLWGSSLHQTDFPYPYRADDREILRFADPVQRR